MGRIDRIVDTLGDQADSLLDHRCAAIPKERLTLTGGDVVGRVYGQSDRSIPTLRSLQAMFNHGRLAGTGYMSILPVDQGIEHSGGASFAKNPDYFDPENIIELAIEGGCNAVATTYGVLGMVARKYAHKIPLMLKINHNDLLSVPQTFQQIMFGQVERAWEMGCTAVGATIYFGSEDSNRQIQEVSQAFTHAHELGMAKIGRASCRERV